MDDVCTPSLSPLPPPRPNHLIFAGQRVIFERYFISIIFKWVSSVFGRLKSKSRACAGRFSRLSAKFNGHTLVPGRYLPARSSRSVRPSGVQDKYKTRRVSTVERVQFTRSSPQYDHSSFDIYRSEKPSQTRRAAILDTRETRNLHAFIMTCSFFLPFELCRYRYTDATIVLNAKLQIANDGTRRVLTNLNPDSWWPGRGRGGSVIVRKISGQNARREE